jgi:hypothetical protein
MTARFAALAVIALGLCACSTIERTAAVGGVTGLVVAGPVGAVVGAAAGAGVHAVHEKHAAPARRRR